MNQTAMLSPNAEALLLLHLLLFLFASLVFNYVKAIYPHSEPVFGRGTFDSKVSARNHPVRSPFH